MRFGGKFIFSVFSHNIVEDAARVNAENVLEERDPGYDAMLGQMVGRIQSKPGGKLEMGEVCFSSWLTLKLFIVRKQIILINRQY